ncbi:inositol-3-phosphate synthase [Actinokineospora guangxiensis]|uniref:Inositol-3-phosphate synthase n=1 Tax=Actinokineospora guangxiensis TaxID=1490288 RepID=A0ABW0ETV1_9PSEU
MTVSASGRVGLWLVGARGSVATTAVCGLAALRAGLAPATGCVTERLPGAVLPAWDDIVVGGHDLVTTSYEKRAEHLSRAGVIPHHLLAPVVPALRAADAEVRDGYHPTTHRGPQALAVRRLAADLETFRFKHELERVVVVNVASTEPPVPHVPAFESWSALSAALDDPALSVLPPSSVAACAALTAGCSYVDFTPSTGVAIPALDELARHNGVPYAGRDGKTGETLLRTALAPMFTDRALRVLSWSGTNLLGGGDGATLADPASAASKLRSKSDGLATLLGGPVSAPLHIDNVPDLGEQKIAWDHVTFEGFLGARMSLQFTWTGLDSALAAPLVLDLTRLLAAAHASGISGVVPELGFFFKDPLGSEEHRFDHQSATLTAWAQTLGGAR